MRTTLTLDEDVARRLEAKVHQSESTFKAVVNETLRLGLDLAIPQRKARFVWRDSPLQAGVPFESTSDLLERLDTPDQR